MSDTITYTGVLTVIDCGVCHVDFAIDRGWLANLQRTGDWFYCPNGHKIHYYKTENQKLEQEKAALQRRLDSANARASSWRDQAEAAERSKTAIKGHNTRLKRRVAAGVCPCCTRTFQNLQRHMVNQHPDYAADTGSADLRLLWALLIVTGALALLWVSPLAFALVFGASLVASAVVGVGVWWRMWRDDRREAGDDNVFRLPPLSPEALERIRRGERSL